jgi:hypothetical protein
VNSTLQYLNICKYQVTSSQRGWDLDQLSGDREYDILPSCPFDHAESRFKTWSVFRTPLKSRRNLMHAAAGIEFLHRLYDLPSRELFYNFFERRDHLSGARQARFVQDVKLFPFIVSFMGLGKMPLQRTRSDSTFF